MKEAEGEGFDMLDHERNMEEAGGHWAAFASWRSSALRLASGGSSSLVIIADLPTEELPARRVEQAADRRF